MLGSLLSWSVKVCWVCVWVCVCVRVCVYIGPSLSFSLSFFSTPPSSLSLFFSLTRTISPCHAWAQFQFSCTKQSNGCHLICTLRSKGVGLHSNVTTCEFAYTSCIHDIDVTPYTRDPCSWWRVGTTCQDTRDLSAYGPTFVMEVVSCVSVCSQCGCQRHWSYT